MKKPHSARPSTRGFTIRRRASLIAAMGASLLAAVVVAGPPVQAATSHDAIEATGSSWSANAINQWVADVQSSGLRVVYTPAGSAQGRQDFAAYNSDMGVSDIGYQGNDPKTGASDSSDRPYAYLPIVAGGTAFPYNLQVGGKRVTSLRLSGLTLAKIFTNQITNWNDAAITADNNGQALPSKSIIPVVHSEGAGSTAQFTRYLATEYPSLWNPFNGASGMTEYFPAQGADVAQSGSDGVMNYVASASGDGTIGYDEYSYALNIGFPVAKIENTAGYYTLPTAQNDAVALTQAQINMDPTSKDYLLQNLDNVYSYNDNRTYPLSSYSYAIIPTASTDRRMTMAKRQTMADFLFYSVCGGQAEMGPIGYSPLPLNLVTASFAQISKLHTADPAVDVSEQAPQSCDNPTFDKTNPDKNLLAETAPQPQPCDHQGQGPCGSNAPAAATPGAVAATGANPVPSAGSTTGPGGRVSVGIVIAPGAKRSTSGATKPNPATSAGVTSTGGQAAGKVGSAAGGASSAANHTKVVVDPVTGQKKVVSADNAVAEAGTGFQAAADASAVPTDVQAYQDDSSSSVSAILVVLLLILVLTLPPTLIRVFGRKGAGS